MSVLCKGGEKSAFISDRHIRRLLVELEQRGDRAVIHGLLGRPSNRRLAARLKLNILRRVRQRYADFGPTLAEHLAQEASVRLQYSARKRLGYRSVV
jgi:hypothetical protein